MIDINILLAQLTNNDNLELTKSHTSTHTEESNTLSNGFPGDPDQFFRLQRPSTSQKKTSDQEFEADLISKINMLNDVLFEHQTDIEIIKKARVQIEESVRDLNEIIADNNSSVYQRAHFKFQLLKDMYTQLDGLVSSTKTRKIKEKDVELTQSQMVILFHHLRELGIISKKASNTILAQSISDMTGLSAEKMRQSLSSISSYSKNIDADFEPTDYEAVNDKIKALMLSLKADLNERFK